MPVIYSQPRWTIDKFPWHPESFRQMRGERFNAEYFRRVMSSEQEIHTDLFRRNRGPVRRFSSDEGVDSFGCDPVNFRTRSSGHNAYRARTFRAEIKNFYRTTQGLF